MTLAGRIAPFVMKQCVSCTKNIHAHAHVRARYLLHKLEGDFSACRVGVSHSEARVVWRLYRHCQEDPDRRQKQHTHLGMQSEQMHARVDVDAMIAEIYHQSLLQRRLHRWRGTEMRGRWDGAAKESTV